MVNELNTRVALHEQPRALGRPATLDDICDCQIEHLVECRPAWDGNWTADCFIA
jgi:hypothetical protein